MMDLILNLLKQEDISNIYVGVTSIFVAIVIFIAEVVKDQGNELNKKVILCKSNIKENIIDILVIFFYMLIINMFNYNGKNDIYDLMYLMSHGILLGLVIISIYKTGKMFCIALKLNTEKDYFNKELENYVYERALILENKANSKNNKKYKNEKNKFETFLKKQKIYFSDKNKINENYEAIYPIKNGIMEKYEYNKLIDLANYFHKQKISEENYSINNKNIVYIPDNIGKKINRKEPIFYCLKQYINIFKNLGDTVIYANVFIDDEIKLINKCLFEHASEYEEPYAYDENRILYNYFKYLYDNNLYEIKSLALINIEETYKKIYNNYSKNQQFAKFLDLLSALAYSNNDYDAYEYINNIELYLYIDQLDEKEIDIKKVAYNFVNNMIRFNLYSLKKNSDIRYYDNLMSILLRFIIYLIKTSNYQAIGVLFDNIFMERINYKEKDFDKYDIINFQFSCGIIYCLIMLSNHDLLKEESFHIINKIINYMKNHFIKIYDAWDAIVYFNKYYEKETCVQKVYSNFEFEFIDHKYKSIWYGECINTTQVIKELLFIFHIAFVNIESIDTTQIDRKDIYFFKEILDLVKEKEPSKLDKFLDINYNNKWLVEALNIAIKKAENKEKEYIRNKALNENKVEKFKRIIKQNLKKSCNFINFLKKHGKIKESKDKLKIAFGINQLIPRETFFDDVGGYEDIANSYCETLNIGIESEYIKNIEKMSDKSIEPLENFLNKIDNLEDYIIISNYLNESYFDRFEYDYKNNVIIHRNKKISIINIPQISGIFLLKKMDLPTINFCSFSDEWNSNFIENSIYLELTDCAENKDIRKEILKNSVILKEKDDEERENYLKEYCRIRLYLACTIINNPNSLAIQFDVKE